MLNERIVSKSNSTNILSIPRDTIRKVKANALDIVANTRSIQESHRKLIKSALSRIDNDSTLQNSSSLKSPQEYMNRISQGTCTYIDPINDSPQNVFAIEKNESIWFIAGSCPAVTDNESERNSQEKDNGKLPSAMYNSHSNVYSKQGTNGDIR